MGLGDTLENSKINLLQSVEKWHKNKNKIEVRLFKTSTYFLIKTFIHKFTHFPFYKNSKLILALKTMDLLI